MSRFPHRALLCLSTATFALSGGAHATDIDCDPAAAPARQTTAHRLICESALFSMGYQRIYAEQQRMLKAGSVTEADIAAFRAKRDRCDSAACLDTTFREWKSFAGRVNHKP
ncbi:MULTISPECIES: hypothetical protein [Cupriavidus]|nr:MULTISPECIES: hypothetical protein [Cupriavidus]QYY28596.1 hypothetical protein K2O51_12095 [Cupriavidus pinatubonensis]